MNCEICGREQDKLCTIKGHHVCYKHYQQFIFLGRFTIWEEACYTRDYAETLLYKSFKNATVSMDADFSTIAQDKRNQLQQIVVNKLKRFGFIQ